MPACVKEQVDTLIQNGILELIGEEQLSDIERSIYDATFASLASVMLNPNKPRKNVGEISTLAMAKTKSITYFGMDEKDLQAIIDEKLNSYYKKIYMGKYGYRQNMDTIDKQIPWMYNIRKSCTRLINKAKFTEEKLNPLLRGVRRNLI